MVGRVPGAIGQASMMANEYVVTARSNTQLKKMWLHRLENKGKTWQAALRDAFRREDRADRTLFASATGGLFSNEEGERLFTEWAHNGIVERADVLKDLTAIDRAGQGGALFANANKGASLDAYIKPGSKAKSNLESSDSSLAQNDGAYAVDGVLASAAARPITAASRSKPLPVGSPAGVAMVTGGTGNNASSVQGGIFSAEFLLAALPKGTASNKSNMPSQPGGIFAENNEPPAAPAAKSRSQLSSVPGGIFAHEYGTRPDTHEYGYERFPREGLKTHGL